MNASTVKTYLTQFRLFIICSLVSLLIGIGIGFALGHWAYAPKSIQEVAKPAIKLPATPTSPYGAVISEVAPDSHAKPKQAIPHGFKPLRVGGATVAIKPEASPQAAADKAAAPISSSIRFDWTLAQATDGGNTMFVSSPNGEITQAIDQPLGPTLFIPSRPYAAGLVYSTAKNYGVWIDRDFGRIRTGLQVNTAQTNDSAHSPTLEAWAKLGFTFGG